MYMDDLCCHSDEEEAHYRDLEALFIRFKLDAFNCKLSVEKCLFFRASMPFLGHVVSREGLKADPRKTAAVDAFQVEKMKTTKDLKVFLHTIGYLRKFIRNFAKVAEPLSKYLKKGARLKRLPMFGRDQAARWTRSVSYESGYAKRP